MMTPHLQLRAVGKRLGSTEVLDAISLEVRAGEFVSILGPSGAGKSTILNLLIGALTADRGQILVDGQPPGRQPPFAYMPVSYTHLDVYKRQAEGCIQSGFFHRFACTIHSPVGLNPAEYGIKLKALPPISFATNDVEFIDPTGVDHNSLGQALNKALYNYMHGIGLDEDVRSWFGMKLSLIHI